MKHNLSLVTSSVVDLQDGQGCWIQIPSSCNSLSLCMMSCPMMQEHRPRQASQRGRQRMARQVQSNLFEFSFKRTCQCINDAFMKERFCILYQTSSHTLLSEVDKEAFNLVNASRQDLLLDQTVLDGRRENGYRHPHLYIVTLFIQEQERRASRELCREHPCTDIELIEESFDSNPWLCVYSLCIEVVFINVCLPVMHFLCICCA